MTFTVAIELCDKPPIVSYLAIGTVGPKTTEKGKIIQVGYVFLATVLYWEWLLLGGWSPQAGAQGTKRGPALSLLL